MKLYVEHTDTFGGEANYSWVVRETLDVPDDLSDLAIMRRAKRAVGIHGMRGRTENYGGDEFVFRPWGSCSVMFVTCIVE